MVYAIALNSVGRSEEAIAVLEQTHDRLPGNRDILVKLVMMNRDRGNIESAIDYAEKLARLSADDPNLQRLIDQLKEQNIH